MTTKYQTLFVIAVSNALWLIVVAFLIHNAQSAQAQSPSALTLGPYFITFSGADFVPYSTVDFPIRRDVYAVVRDGTSGIGIGVAGFRLPANATIIELANESENTAGPTDLRLLECPINGTTCAERANASQTTSGRARRTIAMNLLTDHANNAYLLQLDLPNNSKFYYARIAYTIPTTATSVFIPAVIR